MPTFWIYHDSEYPSETKCTKALNIPGLQRVLLILKYVWICQNMYEYIYICLNDFWFLKKPQTVFLKRKYLIFSKEAESIWFFFFYFRLYIFANNNFDVVTVDFPLFVASSGLIRDSKWLQFWLKII